MRNILLKGLLGMALFLSPIFLFASEDVEITVSGSCVNKESAVNNALRSALEQSYITFVSTNTKVLKDKLVSDEMVSFSRGNIKSYNVLLEKQLANGHWYVLLKAIVNVSKLAKYVQGEGSSVEIDMNAVSSKFQMEELSRNAERKIIENLITEIEAIDYLWDYSLDLDEPSLSDGRYVISGVVNVKYNKNTTQAVNLMSVVFSELDISSHSENNGEGYSDYLFSGVSLRNKYNNGLLYFAESIYDRYGFHHYFHPSGGSGSDTSTFLKKIRFAIEPLNIRIDGNNTSFSYGRDDLEYSKIYVSNQLLYLIVPQKFDMYYAKKRDDYTGRLMNMPRKVGDVIFKIYFEKKLSREEALRIKNVTVRPL